MIRVDRADCLLPDVIGSLGRSVAVHLTRSGYAHACIVSYSEGPLDRPDPAVEALVDALEDIVEVTDAWLVRDDRFRSQWCTDYACCPRRGVPIGSSEAERRATGIHDSARPRPTSDPAARRRALRAKDRAIATRGKKGAAWNREAYGWWCEAVEQSMDGQMPGDAVAGRLLAALETVPVRDAIVVDLDGGGTAGSAVLAGGEDARVRDSLWALVEGHPSRDSARVEAAVDVALYLASLAAGSRGGANAAPMTVAAIGHWWLGDPVSAQHLTDAALAAQPDYRLAQLVSATLLAGLRTV
jgi:hypothetical protein